MTEPTNRDGKVCYIEMPAVDVERSAQFYESVFGWGMRRRGDGATAFDDTTGQVSGAFVTGRVPHTAPGLVVYVMVADAKAAMARVRAAGGTIVHESEPSAREVIAHFRDPAGNVLGIYEERALRK